MDGALGFGYLQGDYVRVFDLLTGINLSKIKMQYSKIIFLPHRIGFSFPDWSRAVGDESPYHGSRHESLSRMLVMDLL